MQTTMLYDIALCPFIPGDKFALQIQLVDEPPYGFRETWTLRTGFKQKAASPDGLDHTAGVPGSLEYKGLQPELLQAKGTRQAGDSCANHHNFFRVSHSKQSLSKV